MRQHRLRLVALSFIVLIPSALIAGSAGSTRLSTITSDPYQVVVEQHLVEPFISRVLPAIVEAPFGYGLGTFSPGTRYVLDVPNTQITPESYIAALVLEVGILGLLAYALLMLALAWALANVTLKSNDPYGRVFAAACLAVLIWVLQLSPTYEPLSYYPFAQLFWLTCGMAIGLNRGRPDLVAPDLTSSRTARP